MAKKAFISMTPFKVTVNQKQLLKEVHVKNARAMSQKLRGVIEPKLEKKQDNLVKKFRIHPITIEIDGGPRATNSSGTLGGYGNLFSFIGFDSGDNPTEVIKMIFGEKIKFRVKRRNASGKYTIVFFIRKACGFYFSFTGFFIYISICGWRSRRKIIPRNLDFWW